MPICPICHRLLKTAQGLSGHTRFRHQMIVPKQDMSIYARDRLEKAEDENTKLREQVARHQRQLQDQETFHEKRMAERKIESERAQERKLAEQQRAAGLKQHEEQVRSERARADEKVITALQKQLKDLQREIEQLDSQKKKTYELGKSPPEIKGQETNTAKAGELISDLLPPLPHPRHPVSSLKEIERWLFG